MKKRIKRIISGVSIALLLALSVFVLSADFQLSRALRALNVAELLEAANQGAHLDITIVEGRIQNPILYAWQRHYQPYIIELLVQCGANVDYADSRGRTLLMYASGYNPAKYSFYYAAQKASVEDYARIFLSHGASVNLKDKNGLTAIDYAVMLQNDVDRVKLLLEYGAEITRQTFERALNTPTIGAYDYDKMALLMENIDSPEIYSSLAPCVAAAMQKRDFSASEYSLMSAENQNIALFYTAAFGTSEMLGSILPRTSGSQYAQHLQDPDEHSLLAVAAYKGNRPCVEYLISSFAWSQEQKQSALKYAINNGHVSITELLLENGAFLNVPRETWYSSENWLMVPAENGDVATIQLMVDYGYSLNDEIVWYTMKEAARGGSVDVLQYFLDLGYSLSPYLDASSSYRDLFYEACAFQQLGVMKFLLEAGCDISATSLGFEMAVEQHNMELISYLLSVGADPTARTVYEDGSSHLSAYESAVRYGMEDVISLFDEVDSKLS